MKTVLFICCALLLQAFSPADPVQKGKIFLSKDEGESWVRADIGLPDDAAITAWTVLSDIVVVSTENDGMYMSFDKLKSWRHVYKGLPADIKIRSLTTHTKACSSQEVTSMVCTCRKTRVTPGRDRRKGWVKVLSGRYTQ